MRLTIQYITVASLAPTTIVKYVSLSWLIFTTHSFCPPTHPIHSGRIKQRTNTLLRNEDPSASSSPQLTLSEREDAEEARLDSLETRLAAKRETIQNSRLNEMFAEEDVERQKRQAEIDRMLMKDDEVWRRERKKRMLGKFAGMERGEVTEALREEMEKEIAGESVVYKNMNCINVMLVV